MSTGSPIVEHDRSGSQVLLLERAVDSLIALEPRVQEEKVEEGDGREEDGEYEDESEEEESYCGEEPGTTPRAPAAIVSFGPSLGNYGKQRSMFEDCLSTSSSAVALMPGEEEERRRRREGGGGGRGRMTACA